MFQQTIQDIFALAEAGPRAEDILDCLRSRIGAFERFESGEVLCQTERGLTHFVLAPGLQELRSTILSALANESVIRFDTAARLHEQGLLPAQGLASLLVLRLEVKAVTSAALVLGHSRAWSFAGAPLFRLRTIAGVALRLLIGHSSGSNSEEVSKLAAEVARLRARAASLETEIVGLRADRAKRSDKPR